MKCLGSVLISLFWASVELIYKPFCLPAANQAFHALYLLVLFRVPHFFKVPFFRIHAMNPRISAFVLALLSGILWIFKHGILR